MIVMVMANNYILTLLEAKLIGAFKRSHDQFPGWSKEYHEQRMHNDHDII